MIQLPKIILPWPVSPLWPNRGKGGHWAAINGPRQAQRRLAWALAKEAGWRPYSGPVVDVRMTWIACPPTKVSRFDRSNLLAACKGAEDGLADAIGVDDSLFTPTVERGERCKDGGVIVLATIISSAAHAAVERGDSDNLRPFRSIGEIATGVVAKAHKGAAE